MVIAGGRKKKKPWKPARVSTRGAVCLPLGIQKFLRGKGKLLFFPHKCILLLALNRRVGKKKNKTFRF